MPIIQQINCRYRHESAKKSGYILKLYLTAVKLYFDLPLNLTAFLLPYFMDSKIVPWPCHKISFVHSPFVTNYSLFRIKL